MIIGEGIKVDLGGFELTLPALNPGPSRYPRRVHAQLDPHGLSLPGGGGVSMSICYDNDRRFLVRAENFAFANPPGALSRNTGDYK